MKIKNLYPVREGTPYKELHTPIVYGLLAHSHSWKGPNSTPEDNIQRKLLGSDVQYVSHPRQTLDLLCVADFGTWVSGKMTFMETPRSLYVRHTLSHQAQYAQFTPIGTLISSLTRLLAWEDPTLRNLVDYYHVTQIGGNGEGRTRGWPISIYSESVQRGFLGGSVNLPQNAMSWNEWKFAFNVVL